MAAKDARSKIQQIRLKKIKSRGSDLRQIIAKKRVPTKRSSSGTHESRDLRTINKKLASRKTVSVRSDSRTKTRAVTRSSVTVRQSQPVTRKVNTRIGNKPVVRTQKLQQQYYVPPHIQQQQQPYIIAQPALVPQSKLAMDNVPDAQGTSVLISNLMPNITQSEIIELFDSVGVLTGVNMINPTTAMVSYRNSRDAVKAIQLYHGRSLDGKPMYVNMMTNLG